MRFPIYLQTPSDGNEAYSPSQATDYDVAIPSNLSQILANINQPKPPLPEEPQPIASQAVSSSSLPPLPPPPAPPEVKISRDPRQQRVEAPPPEDPTPSMPGEFSVVVSQAGFMVPTYPQPMMMGPVLPGFVPMMPPVPPPVYPMPLPPLPPLPAPSMVPPPGPPATPPAPEPPVIRDEIRTGKWNKKKDANERSHKSESSRGGYWKSGGRERERASASEWEKDIKNYEQQERANKAKLRKLERRHR